MSATVYLIPTVLSEGEVACLPAYVLPTIEKCSALFVENERTARRYLKLLSKEIVIDNFKWYSIGEITADTISAFRQHIKEGHNIGIISEAGCPGVADPGQQLVHIAQQMNVTVKPLVGPNSILLALMASGMNGQQFRFSGYLPIDPATRTKAIRQLENESRDRNCTQIFIETPYRNNQLFETIVKTCSPKTLVCVAVDLTAKTEMIKTQSVQQWTKQLPNIHKRPAIFLLYAGEQG
jgi:16S rRNA (cytidine1402-2'-O)-methyltransferase